MTEKQQEQLKEKIVRAIKTVYDPEIPVDVYELGLIYDIKILPKKYSYPDDSNFSKLPSC